MRKASFLALVLSFLSPLAYSITLEQAQALREEFRDYQSKKASFSDISDREMLFEFFENSELILSFYRSEDSFTLEEFFSVVSEVLPDLPFHEIFNQFDFNERVFNILTRLEIERSLDDRYLLIEFVEAFYDYSQKKELEKQSRIKIERKKMIEFCQASVEQIASSIQSKNDLIRANQKVLDLIHEKLSVFKGGTKERLKLQLDGKAIGKRILELNHALKDLQESRFAFQEKIKKLESDLNTPKKKKRNRKKRNPLKSEVQSEDEFKDLMLKLFDGQLNQNELQQLVQLIGQDFFLNVEFITQSDRLEILKRFDRLAENHKVIGEKIANVIGVLIQFRRDVPEMTQDHILSFARVMQRIMELFRIELLKRSNRKDFESEELAKVLAKAAESKVENPEAKPELSVVQPEVSESKAEVPAAQLEPVAKGMVSPVQPSVLLPRATPIEKKRVGKTQEAPTAIESPRELGWTVVLKKGVQRTLDSGLELQQAADFEELIRYLEKNGPKVNPTFAMDYRIRNYGALSPIDFHAHLGSSNTVAVWRVIDLKKRQIVIYYLGGHPNTYKRVLKAAPSTSLK